MPEDTSSGACDDAYQRLSRFLNTMPGGFPETGTKVEIKILKRLFTVPEAEMLMKMTVSPETAAVIAERAGMALEEAEKMLESMSKQGSCMRFRAGGQTLYAAVSFAIGIYEYHLNTIDRELAELFEEYLPHLGAQWTCQKTQQVRFVPIGAAIDTSQVVATYDLVRDLARQKDSIMVAECICRKEQGLLGHECEKPHETCIRFGMVADYCVENRMGRPITTEECLEIIDGAEEHGLVLMTTNCEDIVNVCSCCSCCCAVLKSLKALPEPAKHAVSSFRSWIDPDVCRLCGTCLERCPMEAITKGQDFSSIDGSRCIGCGLCVNSCPENAISLEAKPETATPPANVGERNRRMLEERGLL